jgi:aryl-alcohol dehydrogenase-like predicted oxidoreductase
VNVIATGGELTRPAEDRDIYAARHAAFAKIARDRGVSPQRLTLAWMLALAPTVIPIPGAGRPESVTDSAQAADLTLTSGEVARLSKS